MEQKNRYLGFLEERKILLVVIFLLISMVATLIGAFSPISTSEANATAKELEETISHTTASSIFGNNFMLCLFMFAPFVGPLFGLFVLYNTGWVLGAIAVDRGLSRMFAFAVTFMVPVAWLEYLAYSIAMAQSTWLSMRIVQGRFRKELTPTAILISIDALILLLAAFIEILLI